VGKDQAFNVLMRDWTFACCELWRRRSARRPARPSTSSPHARAPSRLRPRAAFLHPACACRVVLLCVRKGTKRRALAPSLQTRPVRLKTSALVPPSCWPCRTSCVHVIVPVPASTERERAGSLILAKDGGVESAVVTSLVFSSTVAPCGGGVNDLRQLASNASTLAVALEALGLCERSTATARSRYLTCVSERRVLSACCYQQEPPATSLRAHPAGPRTQHLRVMCVPCLSAVCLCCAS